MKPCLVALLLVVSAAPAFAAQEGTTPAEAMRLLRQMATAARELNYTGTFVYKHGGQIETSRIWHLTDATGDYERLEALDGPPREVVRANEEVTCYYPAVKTAKVERWVPSRRFPAVVSEQLSAIVSNYTVRTGGLARVAGHDCRIATLEPRDALRYGYVFCAEVKTGLPLRATTLNERSETVEMFAFTQVEIGAPIAREQVRASYDVHAPGWKLDHSSAVPNPAKDGSWMVLHPPAGYRKVIELQRKIQGKTASQIVFSDGLAAVSVFIEPAAAGLRGSQEFTHHGAINVFIRPHAGYVVTALGEAPIAAVMQFANSTYRAGQPQ